jgi:hypothetical protein
MTISSWPRVQAWCSSVCPVCITHTHTNEPILLLLFSVMQTNLLSSVDGFRIFGEQLNEVSQVSPFNTQEERLLDGATCSKNDPRLSIYELRL